MLLLPVKAGSRGCSLRFWSSCWRCLCEPHLRQAFNEDICGFFNNLCLFVFISIPSTRIYFESPRSNYRSSGYAGCKRECKACHLAGFLQYDLGLTWHLALFMSAYESLCRFWQRLLHACCACREHAAPLRNISGHAHVEYLCLGFISCGCSLRRILVGMLLWTVAFFLQWPT